MLCPGRGCNGDTMSIRDIFKQPDISQRQPAEKASEAAPAKPDETGLHQADPRTEVAYGRGAQLEDVLVSAKPAQTVTYNFGQGADDKEPTPSVPMPEQDHGVVAQPQEGVVIIDLAPPEIPDGTVSGADDFELVYPTPDDEEDDDGDDEGD